MASYYINWIKKGSVCAHVRAKVRVSGCNTFYDGNDDDDDIILFGY